MGLSAATYLGDNAVAILDRLVAELRRSGIDIYVDRNAGRSSAEAKSRAAEVDLVWMCGYLATLLVDEGGIGHEIVAAPVFVGENGPRYRSVFVTRADGPTSIDAALLTTIAINELESWSGHLGLRSHLGERWFAAQLITGSHRGSIAAILDDACSIAGIDSTLWNHWMTNEPDTVADLKVIGQTDNWPAPPFLLHQRVAAERERLTAALYQTAAAGLANIVPASAEDYASMRPR